MAVMTSKVIVDGLQCRFEGSDPDGPGTGSILERAHQDVHPVDLADLRPDDGKERQLRPLDRKEVLVRPVGREEVVVGRERERAEGFGVGIHDADGQERRRSSVEGNGGFQWSWSPTPSARTRTSCRPTLLIIERLVEMLHIYP